MGYTFTCDDCGTQYDRAPAFMGEFRETFLKTDPRAPPFTDAGYQPGVTVTICAVCMEDLL